MLSQLQGRARPFFAGMTIVVLSGCGTFQLSGGAYAPAGRTSEQQQLDVLVCKDRAVKEANTAGRQTGAFFLGMTIVGAPVAYEMEKRKQREVYAECLTERGYKVIPYGADATVATTQSPGPTAAAMVIPRGPVSNVAIPWPAGWQQRALSGSMVSAEAIGHAINTTVDCGAYLGAVPRASVSDLAAFASSRQAAQASRLTGSELSAVEFLDVG